MKRALREYGIPFEVRFSERREIPQRDLEKMLRERKSYGEVAKEFGVSPATVAKRVREYGLDVRELRRPTREDVKRLVDRGYTLTELCIYFDVTKGTMRRWLKDYGLKLNGRKRDTTPARIPKSLLEKWYVEEGLSVPKISRELGVSESTVYSYLRRYGISRRRRRGGEVKKEDIVKLYVHEGLSVRETARRLRIGTDRLLELMDRYGIERRKKSDYEYSDEELLAVLRRAYEKYGGVPRQRDFAEDEEFQVDVKTIVRRFGSWRGAFERLFQPPHSHP